MIVVLAVYNILRRFKIMRRSSQKFLRFMTLLPTYREKERERIIFHIRRLSVKLFSIKGVYKINDFYLILILKTQRIE